MTVLLIKKKVKATRLSKRDYEILSYMAEVRVATADEIGEKFWTSNNSHTHYRRLRLLKAAGLLRPIRGDRGVNLGLALTKKGRNALRVQVYPADLPKWRTPSYKTTYDHDAILRKLRPIFESSPLVSEFVGDLELRSRLARRLGNLAAKELASKVPDAIFKLTLPDRTLRVALELEIARKNRFRRKEFFRRLMLASDVDSVFIVAAHDNVAVQLLDMLKEVRGGDPFVTATIARKGFYVAQLDNLLADRTQAIFRGEGKTFSLEDLAKRIPV